MRLPSGNSYGSSCLDLVPGSQKAGRPHQAAFLVALQSESSMAQAKINPKTVAAQIRRALKDGGSAEHAESVQWFFKEQVKSHGWYTADLRRAVRQFRKEIRKTYGLPFLVKVADQLFPGSILEQKVAAVFLLENLDSDFDDAEFEMFERWLDRIQSWSDHDALVHDLIAPMLIAKPSRAKNAMRWAKSANRWHRRAACVALIRGTRQKMFLPEIRGVSNLLLSDNDDMVQKGLGWLLRESAKFDPKRTIPYLMKIRESAQRLVLRTACETLPKLTRTKILSIAPNAFGKTRIRA
jgi:3-methyladenine DNA glycosylase AlkD